MTPDAIVNELIDSLELAHDVYDAHRRFSIWQTNLTNQGLDPDVINELHHAALEVGQPRLERLNAMLMSFVEDQEVHQYV